MIKECEWQVGHHLCNHRKTRHPASVHQDIFVQALADSRHRCSVVTENHALGES